jgi:hypothetical protein
MVHISIYIHTYIHTYNLSLSLPKQDVSAELVAYNLSDRVQKVLWLGAAHGGQEHEMLHSYIYNRSRIYIHSFTVTTELIQCDSPSCDMVPE